MSLYQNMNKLLNKVSLYRETKDKLQILNFNLFNNILRLRITSADKDKPRNNKIVVNYSIAPDRIRQFIELMKDLEKKDIEEQDNKKYELLIEIYGMEWDKNNKPIPGGKVFIGGIGMGKIKNKENEIIYYVIVTDKNREKYLFPFLKTPYEEYYINGKKVEDKTTISYMRYKGFIASMEDILGNLPELIDNDEETEKRLNKRNNNIEDNKKESALEEAVTTSEESVDDLF